ncbi:hypothetical protein FQA39_LY01227 [Lamprigera yunnana]|nr:hypothetical protein FQA39_LY01227 [Lamprigera yunnana]
MSVKMWKIIFFVMIWTTIVFGFSVDTDGKQNKGISKDDPTMKESISIEPELLELKGIYYTTGSRSRIFVEYPNEGDVLRFGKNVGSEENSSSENEDNSFQPWSILWYIGSFGGLIAFFLVVSCSEWCCRTHMRARNSHSTVSNSSNSIDIPPPAYDLFAPPSYDSLCGPSGEKSKYDVYVVPVHTLNTLRDEQASSDVVDSPPSYSEQGNNEVVLNVRLVEGLPDRPKVESESSTDT